MLHIYTVYMYIHCVSDMCVCVFWGSDFGFVTVFYHGFKLRPCNGTAIRRLGLCQKDLPRICVHQDGKNKEGTYPGWFREVISEIGQSWVENRRSRIWSSILHLGMNIKVYDIRLETLQFNQPCLTALLSYFTQKWCALNFRLISAGSRNCNQGGKDVCLQQTRITPWPLFPFSLSLLVTSQHFGDPWFRLCISSYPSPSRWAGCAASWVCPWCRRFLPRHGCWPSRGWPHQRLSHQFTWERSLMSRQPATVPSIALHSTTMTGRIWFKHIEGLETEPVLNKGWPS